MAEWLLEGKTCRNIPNMVDQQAQNGGLSSALSKYSEANSH